MRDAVSISRRSACCLGGGTLLASPFAATAGSSLVTLPMATFGVQIYDDETARVLTLKAIEAGFRSFFASTESGNQRGFAAAIRESGVPRDSLFITGSVLSDAGDSLSEAYSLTEQGCRENARNLLESGGIEQLDMLLLEFPARSRAAICGQWRAMEKARAAGLTRQIGCANFALSDLDAVLTDRGTRTRPAVNQRCYSLAFRYPYPELRAAHAARGVPLQAWSPLGGTPGLPAEVRTVAAAIGRRDGRGASAQQVALRWCTQRGVGFSVHSSSLDHLRQDLGSAALQLRPEELAELDALVDGPLLPGVPI